MILLEVEIVRGGIYGLNDILFIYLNQRLINITIFYKIMV